MVAAPIEINIEDYDPDIIGRQFLDPSQLIFQKIQQVSLCVHFTGILENFSSLKILFDIRCFTFPVVNSDSGITIGFTSVQHLRLILVFLWFYFRFLEFFRKLVFLNQIYAPERHLDRG